MYQLTKTGTSEYKISTDGPFLVYFNATEEEAQQIVTALNAWQAIQQAYLSAETNKQIIDRISVHVERGVIPKNVHSAREDVLTCDQCSVDLSDVPYSITDGGEILCSVCTGKGDL